MTGTKLCRRGLQGGDIMWIDSKSYPGDTLEHARAMMNKGGYIEYDCYDNRGRSQGASYPRAG